MSRPSASNASRVAISTSAPRPRANGADDRLRRGGDDDQPRVAALPASPGAHGVGPQQAAGALLGEAPRLILDVRFVPPAEEGAQRRGLQPPSVAIANG